MKRLKLQSLAKGHKLIGSLFYFILIINTNLLAQSNKCTINEFLISTIRSSVPVISLEKMGKFKDDLKRMPDFENTIKVDGIQYGILMEKYKLSGNLFLKIGKAKIKGDSILYFNVDPKKELHSYIIKKDCLLTLMGYNINKGEVQIYFKLSSKSCEILFCFDEMKSRLVLEQFDFM